MDRGPSEHTIQCQLASLLDQIKQLRRVSFVLAVQRGRTHGDLLRLCEHLEVVRAPSVSGVVSVIHAFRSSCLRAFEGDVDPVPPKERESLFVVMDPLVRGVFRYQGSLPTGEALGRLLMTPRCIKSSLRRTMLTWEKLHGEIDFDDLLFMDALRFGAPEAYPFLVNRIDDLRRLAQANASEGKIKELGNASDQEWKSILSSADCDAQAVEKVMELVWPAFLRVGNQYSGRRLQSISRDWPTDYWGRLNAGDIGGEELRDQTVLSRNPDIPRGQRCSGPRWRVTARVSAQDAGVRTEARVL